MIFYKMQATENDFILILNQKLNSMQVQRLCDRHVGIGADGILNIDNQQDITIYNQDGSTASMCGNGLRCVAKLLHDLTKEKEFRVFIEGNPIRIAYEKNNGKIYFDKPYFLKKKLEYGFFVDVKNQHFVQIVKDIDNFVFSKEIEKFVKEHQCNYEIVEIIDKNNVKIRVFEYGVGETNSCGSGTIAAFFVLNEFLMIEDEALFHFFGGTLKVKREEEYYILEGEVSLVFKGEYLDVL